MKFRKYIPFPSLPGPLIDGDPPSYENLTDRFFIVVAPAPNDHILSEAEWSEVIEDNILHMGHKREPRSRYKLSELRIYHHPFPEEALRIIEKNN